MAENFQNFYVTKLREACDASATTIYVETIPTITEGTLVIEYASSTKHEIIHFTGRSGYSLTGCTRGYEGTTAQSHSAGVDVRQNVTAGILDKITNRAITTENIADEAVTTAKIDDGAVTSDKIDFTTLTTTLYSGTSGKTGTLTLSDAIENYDYFVIKFRREDMTRTMSSLLVHNDKSSVSFTMTTTNISSSFTTYNCMATISGTTFTFVAGGALAANSSGIQGYASSNEIKVLEIIGIVAS